MSTKSEASTANVFSMLGDTLESAAEAFEEASVNSSESAKRAAKTTKRAVGNFLHGAAYGVSYGLVYAGVFVTELIPETNLVRRGLAEGAEAALDARKKVAAVKSGNKTKLVKASVAKPPKRRTKASPRAKKVVVKRADEFDSAAAAAS
ncbi:MAG TPA: hypothetical protein VIH58_05610 [Chthoniobacterales bacterium]|jgi:hypothetical protein